MTRAGASEAEAAAPHREPARNCLELGSEVEAEARDSASQLDLMSTNASTARCVADVCEILAEDRRLAGMLSD